MAAAREPSRQVTEKPMAWEPITEDAYRALNLTEKIRHHEIAALYEVSKAGPQVRDKRPIPPAEMPREWHVHRERAATHRSEAKRLWDVLEAAKERGTGRAA
jgi:hypothetical protein